MWRARRTGAPRSAWHRLSVHWRWLAATWLHTLSRSGRVAAERDDPGRRKRQTNGDSQNDKQGHRPPRRHARDAVLPAHGASRCLCGNWSQSLPSKRAHAVLRGRIIAGAWLAARSVMVIYGSNEGYCEFAAAPAFTIHPGAALASAGGGWQVSRRPRATPSPDCPPQRRWCAPSARLTSQTACGLACGVSGGCPWRLSGAGSPVLPAPGWLWMA